LAQHITASTEPKPRATIPATRLLYVVTEDWYFLLHRLPMARAAREAGFEVHVATNVKDGAAAIAEEGFVLHAVPFARGRISPFASLRTIWALRRVYRAVAPAIIHHNSLQPIVLGSIAALATSAVCVNAFTGLGYAFTTDTLKAATVKRLIMLALPRLLDRARAITLVENSDDVEVLASLGVPKQRIVIGHGSGVDVTRLQPLSESNGPPTAAFVGRLLDDKGIRVLIEAHRLLRARGSEARLLIAGTPDPANPASVTQTEAASWNEQPGITWLGHVADISGLWARAHIAVLPSRREGLPLSLLEAAACGRAMVATDVPGCREIVIAGETGILVPVDDAVALAAAMERLFRESQLRAQFAAAARHLVVERFSAEIVGRQIVALYRGLLDAKSGTNAGGHAQGGFSR
jgi:glycosyltransferase involved in cell wall biosynthesis